MTKSAKKREMQPVCSVGRCWNDRRPDSEFCALGASHRADKDAATKLATGRGTYAEFLAECKRGYVPTIRPEMAGLPFVEKHALYVLRDALSFDGVRIYPAAGTPDKELV